MTSSKVELILNGTLASYFHKSLRTILSDIERGKKITVNTLLTFKLSLQISDIELSGDNDKTIAHFNIDGRDKAKLVEFQRDLLAILTLKTTDNDSQRINDSDLTINVVA